MACWKGRLALIYIRCYLLYIFKCLKSRPLTVFISVTTKHLFIPLLTNSVARTWKIYLAGRKYRNYCLTIHDSTKKIPPSGKHAPNVGNRIESDHDNHKLKMYPLLSFNQVFLVRYSVPFHEVKDRLASFTYLVLSMLADELVVVVPADLWLGVTRESGRECDGFHFFDLWVDDFLCEFWFGVFGCWNKRMHLH